MINSTQPVIPSVVEGSKKISIVKDPSISVGMTLREW